MRHATGLKAGASSPANKAGTGTLAVEGRGAGGGAPTAEQITRRCLDYGYERDKPEWSDCVRLQERDFLLRPKRFVWPGQEPGS